MLPARWALWAVIAALLVASEVGAAPDVLREAMSHWPAPSEDLQVRVSECRSVVVGGGWSGVYAAYRLASSSPETASGVCLFEASHRLGGRTLSVPIEGTEFTLDLGAYRYGLLAVSRYRFLFAMVAAGGTSRVVAPGHSLASSRVPLSASRFTPDMHLPGDVILNLLKLPTKCYEPGCPKASEEFPKPFMFNYTAPLQIIVDPGDAHPNPSAANTPAVCPAPFIVGLVVDSPANILCIL